MDWDGPDVKGLLPAVCDGMKNAKRRQRLFFLIPYA